MSRSGTVMTELWIASNNSKKRAELERLLEPLGFRLRSLGELPEMVDIVEDAPDFAGNAAIKAATLARVARAPAIGDDSGLCVDALDGRPGVHSARYAGAGARDADRIDKLLGELAEVREPRRTARFVCHICLCDADAEISGTFEASCEGAILTEPRGAAGFGYDPVFQPVERPRDFDRPAGEPFSFAELTPAQKDEISHRGRALRLLLNHLRDAS